MSDSDFGMGYALGSDGGSNNSNGGFLGGEGLWAVIILAMIFGWGGNGMGLGGGGQALTRAELYDGFAIQNIDSAVRGVQQGICDSTYALNNAITNGFSASQLGMMQGFNGVERSMCSLGHQISDCCCTTQRSIDALNYNLATQSCDTRNLIQSTTRDIIENQNCNTRSIMDFLVNSKIESLQAENQNLKFAASQAAQNNYLAALSDAQTAELIRRIAPQPVPAYTVPAPYPYGSGYSYGSGCGCSCGV